MDDRQDTACACDPEQFDGAPRLADAPEGSVLLGILGALIGALVGAVPWFLASYFAGFFVGWLGFLVGWAAALGYRMFRGRRSTHLAMTIIVIASVLALTAMDFASNMLSLCTDPEWQQSAWSCGITVQRLAFESLLMPENWSYILPNLGIGLLIGILGVFSARKHVIAYTDPEQAALHARAAAAAASVLSGGVQPTCADALPACSSAQPAVSLRLPERFTMRESRGVIVIGAICTALFGALFVLSLFFLDIPSELGYVLMAAGLTLVGVWCILDGALRRLEVEGEQLRYVTSFGSAREFTAADVSGVTTGSTIRLLGHDGKPLARFEMNMKNSELLMQYLAEHDVPLRG